MKKRIHKDKIISVPMGKALVKEIRSLSKKETRTFSSMTRILLEEALAARVSKS
jgi:hypothetical protein